MSHPDLLRAYIESGLRAHSEGRIEAAKEAYQEVLRVAPDHPDALNLLGAALLQLGEPGAAVDYLQRAARRQRDNPGVIGNLAQAYFALGRFEEAREAFRKASRLDPRHVQFQLGVATSWAMQRNFKEAETLLQRLTARFPDNALVWFNLGNVVGEQHRPAEAVDHHRKALQIDPHFLDARLNLGSALHALQRFDEAEREYRACLRLAPGHPLAQPNLASVLIDQGQWVKAEAVCRDMIAQDSDSEYGWTFLSSVLTHQGRLLDALACYQHIAERAPDDPEAVKSCAAALASAGFCGAAWRWFSRALALNPDALLTRQAFFTALLSEGRLLDGWAEHGHRPAAVELRHKHTELGLSHTLPPDLDGKHVCVLREQGLGDELFFLRFVHELHAAGARVTYRASDKLAGLAARLPFIESVILETESPPAVDATILAGDLPHALNALAASALPRPPFSDGSLFRNEFARAIRVFWPPAPRSIALAPLPERSAQIWDRLRRAGPPPYLGITWRGGTPPRLQRGEIWLLFKEIAIPALATALAAFPGTLLGLQRLPEAGELERLSSAVGRNVHDFTDLNEDFEGMLALLAFIDEYVGVSNTNMHLRAVAGKTARVLVPAPAEWRWLAWGRSSPWFPDFSIYRQSFQGDWGLALSELKADLEKTYPRGANLAKQTLPRECQPCTGCCDGWLQIRVNGVPVYPGHPCPHSTGSGCNDYAHRPVDPCVHFICGWRMDGSPLPDWMKPNNSKVIVLFNQSIWRGMPVDVAVPVGKKIPPRALDWLKQFAESNGRALLYSEQIVENGVFTNKQAVSAFGPPAFQQEMAERAGNGERLW